jgi:predicted dehydrogenase
MLATAAIDAVVVALPTFAHASAAIAVLESGRHLYLESPIASTVEEGCRIVDAWRRSGRVGMIGLNSRYHPLLAGAKRRIDSGAIGEVVAARIAFSSITGSRPAWAQDPRRGGGVLLDKAYHEVDVTRFLFGDIDDVSCVAIDRERPHTVALDLRCARGCLAQLSISIASVADARLDVYGAKGRLSLGRYESLRVMVDGTEAGGLFRRVRNGASEIAGAPFLARKLRAPGNDPSFAVALERFVTAIRGGAGGKAHAAPDLAEGLACLSVVEAARRSLEEGRVIAVTDPVAVE